MEVSIGQDDDHSSEVLFLVCSQLAYKGELSDPDVSLLDVLEFIKNIILSWA